MFNGLNAVAKKIFLTLVFSLLATSALAEWKYCVETYDIERGKTCSGGKGHSITHKSDLP